MVNLFTKNSDLEDTLVTIVGAIKKQKKVAAATPSPPSLNNKLDMEKLFAAFPAGQKLPEAPSEPSTSVIEKKLQEVLDCIKGNTRNVHRSKTSREPN